MLPYLHEKRVYLNRQKTNTYYFYSSIETPNHEIMAYNAKIRDKYEDRLPKESIFYENAKMQAENAKIQAAQDATNAGIDKLKALIAQFGMTQEYEHAFAVNNDSTQSTDVASSSLSVPISDEFGSSLLVDDSLVQPRTDRQDLSTSSSRNTRGSSSATFSVTDHLSVKELYKMTVEMTVESDSASADIPIHMQVAKQRSRPQLSQVQ